MSDYYRICNKKGLNILSDKPGVDDFTCNRIATNYMIAVDGEHLFERIMFLNNSLLYSIKKVIPEDGDPRDGYGVSKYKDDDTGLVSSCWKFPPEKVYEWTSEKRIFFEQECCNHVSYILDDISGIPGNLPSKIADVVNKKSSAEEQKYVTMILDYLDHKTKEYITASFSAYSFGMNLKAKAARTMYEALHIMLKNLYPPCYIVDCCTDAVAEYSVFGKHPFSSSHKEECWQRDLFMRVLLMNNNLFPWVSPKIQIGVSDAPDSTENDYTDRNI